MIICEIGVNWQGNIDLAKKLIVEAKRGGGDLAKFQLYDVDKLFPDKKIIARGKNWYDEVKPTQLTKEQAKMLFNYGESVGIEVFFSVFDTERVKWCEDIGVKRYKIAYNQRDNKKLIKKLLGTGKWLMASVDKADCYVKGAADILLYCVPCYPAPIEAVDFSSLLRFGGFSDHTVGLDASKMALSRGVKIIEKHFCLTRERDGVDIPLSITPDELKELVNFADGIR